MSSPRIAAIALLLTVDAALLVALRPDVESLVRGLTAPRRWVEDDGADRAVVALAGAGLWGAAVWVAVGLVAVVVGRLPGTVGTLAAAFARRALPAALRRIVIGSAGLGVLLTPMSPLAAGAQSPDVPGGRPAATGTPLPGPSWPGSGHIELDRPAPLPAGPSWPGSTTSGPAIPATPSPPRTPTPTPASPSPGTSPPTSRPTTPSNQPPMQQPATTQPTPQQSTAATTERIDVRPGDCLWLLAAHRLGPHADAVAVAAYLPELYAANRDVIGDDPDLVRPGQVLVVPVPGPTDRTQEST